MIYSLYSICAFGLATTSEVSIPGLGIMEWLFFLKLFQAIEIVLFHLFVTTQVVERVRVFELYSRPLLRETSRRRSSSAWRRSITEEKSLVSHDSPCAICLENLKEGDTIK